jgi:hypothetical protein
MEPSLDEPGEGEHSPLRAENIPHPRFGQQSWDEARFFGDDWRLSQDEWCYGA